MVLSGDAHVYDTILDVLIGIYMVALKVKTQYTVTQQYFRKDGWDHSPLDTALCLSP